MGDEGHFINLVELEGETSKRYWLTALEGECLLEREILTCKRVPTVEGGLELREQEDTEKGDQQHGISIFIYQEKGFLHI